MSTEREGIYSHALFQGSLLFFSSMNVRMKERQKGDATKGQGKRREEK